MGGHHNFLTGHLIIFLPVCELSHFISSPLLPHPTNVRPDAIFHNLEKLWRGHKTRLGGGHGIPVPPFDDGPVRTSPVSALTLLVVSQAQYFTNRK